MAEKTVDVESVQKASYDTAGEMAEKPEDVLAAEETASYSTGEMAEKPEEVLAAEGTASCSTGEMAEKPEEVLAAEETASCSTGLTRKRKLSTDNPMPVSMKVVRNKASLLEQTSHTQQAVSELETVGEGEPRLPLHKRNSCYKKDRHGEFIPIREFSIDNLAPPFKDQEIVEVVKLMAALTVRLSVGHISSSRPPPPYPPEKRVDENGKPCSIHGSGFLQTVLVYQEGSGKLCSCSQCKKSGSPRTNWGEFIITTAGHVVFDSFEAEGTTCYFDFDEDNTDIAGITSLIGGNVFFSANDSDEGFDMIYLFFYTHDVDLAEKLGTVSCEYWLNRSILMRKYYGSIDTQAIDVNFYRKFFGCIYSFISELEYTDENRDFVDHAVDKINTIMLHANIPKGKLPTEIAHQYLDALVGGLNTHVQQNYPTLPRSLQPEGNLVIVVSHPHGCGKYVSLGEYTSRQEITVDSDDPEFVRENPPAFFMYTAHTCPGSSGGPVFILSKENVGIFATHVHSEFVRECNQSRCSTWMY